MPTVLGLELGLYVWALVAAAGFAALVATSEAAFLVLRVVGACVLLYLGVKAWVGLWQDRHAPAAGERSVLDVNSEAVPALLGRRQWFARLGEGALVQLANPKAAVFMIAFYPQFIPASRPLFATTAVLALLQVLIETVLYLGLAMGVSRAGTWFRRRTVRRRLEGASGAVLIGLGMRVALTSR